MRPCGFSTDRRAASFLVEECQVEPPGLVEQPRPDRLHLGHVGELDLADLDSVRACAAAFLATGEPLNVLVNNAGIGGAHGLTRQGFELTFGVNHLGHFALTNALLGCLTASAPARVVTVASDAHYSARGIYFEALRRRARGITGLREYAVSKLCNVLFSQELARRTADTGVTSYALHPGVVASDIWRRVPWPVRPLMTYLRSSGPYTYNMRCTW